MNKNTFIFDMDGVLIDSEPFWQRSQISALSFHGVTITPKDCEQYTMGKRIDSIAKIWSDLYHLDIDNQILIDEILHQVVFNIKKNGKEIKGVTALLTHLKKENFKIGLATSSSWEIINAVMDRLSVKKYFDAICSADDEIYGKPNPAVYIKAMEELKSKPEECFVLEDSVSGMIAAKASMAHTIVLTNDVFLPKFSIANHRADSLENVIKYIKK